MKGFVLVIVVIFIGILNDSTAQRPYYDAIELRSLLNPSQKWPDNETTRKRVADILAQYVKRDSIANLLATNPFIKEFATNLSNLSGAGFAGNKEGSLISSLGSLNVTNLADGIARFLIERGKKELNAAFFNRMKKFIDDHEETRILFPATREFLDKIESHQYSEFLQSLREAFYKDLHNLIMSINQVLDLQKYQQLVNPKIRLAIRSVKIVNELSQSGAGIFPDSIITQLAALKEWKDIDPNLGNAWKLLGIISQSVRYVSKDTAEIITDSTDKRTIEVTITERKVDTQLVRDTVITRHSVKVVNTNKLLRDSVNLRWIKLSDMNLLIKDTVALRIFFGLIYQQFEGIYFKSSGTDTLFVQNYLKKNVDNIFKISGLVENFVTLANDVDRTIKDIKDKQTNGSFSNEDYYTYVNKTINILEYGFKVVNSLKPKNIEKFDDKYIIIARNANDLYKNIYTKNYNNAVMSAYNILLQIFENDSSRKFIAGVLKYGNFMASVVKAESGEDVQQALEAAALPAGSYSIKQKSIFNISLNGYIGYAWDFNKVSFKDPYARGIYAPVGITVSVGSQRRRPTVSLVTSIIDVGAIATYRLENGSTETLKQEVRLESIFSPSVQVFVEPIPGLPLAIGGGWRKTPKLFYTDNDPTDNTTFTTVLPKGVFNFSLLIDIPIFTIVNMSFKKPKE